MLTSGDAGGTTFDDEVAVTESGIVGTLLTWIGPGGPQGARVLFGGIGA